MKTSFHPETGARLCAVATLTIAAAGSAFAGPVSLDVTRGAVAVTTNMGEAGCEDSCSVSHLIDQSGLSLPYLSGTTPFDSFVISTVEDSAADAYVWRSGYVNTGFLYFDLGAAYTIDGLAWFGLPSSSNGRVTGIKVYADIDTDATNGHGGLLFDSGTFAANGSDYSSTTANVFNFISAANTRYLDIEIVSNNGSESSGLGEVVFRESLDAPAAAVPEPQSFALAGLGLLALGVTRRRVTKR